MYLLQLTGVMLNVIRRISSPTSRLLGKVSSRTASTFPIDDSLFGFTDEEKHVRFNLLLVFLSYSFHFFLFFRLASRKRFSVRSKRTCPSRPTNWQNEQFSGNESECHVSKINIFPLLLLFILLAVFLLIICLFLLFSHLHHLGISGFLEEAGCNGSPWDNRTKWVTSMRWAEPLSHSSLFHFLPLRQHRCKEDWTVAVWWLEYCGYWEITDVYISIRAYS